MTPADRHQAIVEHLDAVGVCTYQDLAKLLGVSEMTIRRDVDKLVAKAGSDQDLWAACRRPTLPKTSMNRPSNRGRQSIGRKRSRLPVRQSGRSSRTRQSFLDGSTTCIALARRLAKEMTRADRGDALGVGVPGVGADQRRTPSSTWGGSSIRPARAAAVRRPRKRPGGSSSTSPFSRRKGFLPEEGTFESSIATFRIKQIVAEQAARVVLLVDHSKFGQRALCKVLDIGQIHEVITDAGASAADLALVEQRGVAVRVGSARPAGSGGCEPCLLNRLPNCWPTPAVAAMRWAISSRGISHRWRA